MHFEQFVVWLGTFLPRASVEAEWRLASLQSLGALRTGDAGAATYGGDGAGNGRALCQQPAAKPCCHDTDSAPLHVAYL